VKKKTVKDDSKLNQSLFDQKVPLEFNPSDIIGESSFVDETLNLKKSQKKTKKKRK